MAHDEIRAINRVFEEEVIGRRDFGALERVYARDARILPPGAPTVEGRAAIAGFWSAAVAALNVQSLRLHTTSLDVFGDRAQEVGRAELALEGGGAPVALKYVVLWKREDAAWRMDVDIWNMDA
jgi:ketosteroid isomerase-like protein